EDAVDRPALADVEPLFRIVGIVENAVPDLPILDRLDAQHLALLHDESAPVARWDHEFLDQLAAHGPYPFAALIAANTPSAVNGMRSARAPIGRSASLTAHHIAAEAPTVPASPAPLMPSAVPGCGVETWPTSIGGVLSARGIA